jgi:hypothetical protein
MRYLFDVSGFEVEAEYSDFRGSPPKYAAEEVWVARRAGASGEPRTRRQAGRPDTASGDTPGD